MKYSFPLAVFLITFTVALGGIGPVGAKDSTPLPEQGKVPKVDPVNFEEALLTEESHPKALVRAAAEKRLVMTIFASSACPHCNAFQKGVLSSPEFRAFAKGKLVIVVFDITTFGAMTSFERDMIEALKERYRVEGTPHINIESPSEKVLLDTEGYGGTPAAKIVKELEGLWSKEFGT